MTSLFALRTLLFAGELLAASLLILALVWVIASPRTASARHLAWAGAFGALLALPALAALLPSMTQILLPAPPELAPMPISNAALVMAPVPNPPSGFDFDTSDIALALAALWLAGVVLILARFAIGAACLAVLRHKSRPFALAPGDEPKVAARAQECELRLCERDTGPITWGIFRPIILLPRTALSWPRERLHAVLLHELAHIRRRDSLANALSHAACALYWPNPLVWIAAARLRREAEIAADDAVINAGIKPSTYASELLALAQEFRARQTAFAGMALFMAQPSSLEARVESVLAPTQQRSGVTSMDVLKIAGLGLVAATTIALARPSLAQETTPPATNTVSAPVTSAELPPPAAAPEATAEAPAQPDAAAPVAHHHRHVYVADEVPAPPAPPAVPAPAMPALPAAAPLPAMPAAAPLPAIPAAPAPPALSAMRPDGSHLIINDANGTHVWVDGRYYGKLTDADRKHIREDIEAAKREARAATENARRETEEALRQARMSERAVRAVQPDIDRAKTEIERHRADIERAEADVARHRVDIERAEQAVRDAKPQIDAAVAEMAKHKGEIEAAMAKVQPEIDAAMAKVRAEMAKQHIDVKIDEKVDAALKRAEIHIRATEKHVRDRDSNQDDEGDGQTRVEERTTTQDEQ